MAVYEKIGKVQHGGLMLWKQDRVFHDEAGVEVERIPLCSWRQARARGSNRRFYRENNDWWDADIRDVLAVMESAERKGYFEGSDQTKAYIVRSDYRDWPRKEIDEIYSKCLVEPMSNRDPDSEWRGCIAHVCYQRCGSWRKVMLVHPETGRITFRSFTIEAGYKHSYKTFKTKDGWFLDQSMLDAHPVAFLMWLRFLQTIRLKLSSN